MLREKIPPTTSTKSRLHEQLSLVITFLSWDEEKKKNIGGGNKRPNQIELKPVSYRLWLRMRASKRASSLKCQIECISWWKKRNRLVCMYAAWMRHAKSTK